MKIIYTTDLHGAIWKYEQFLKIAKHEDVDMMINGGDILPYYDQLTFVQSYLSRFMSRVNESETHYVSCMGNDDCIVFDTPYQTLCNRYEYVINLAQNKFDLNGYEFIGMNWVCDYPFRLKDRCRLDDSTFQLPPQNGAPVLSTGEEISDYRAVGT